VTLKGGVYLHRTLEEFCEDSTCSLHDYQDRSHFACPDPDERFRNERRVGCGLIEVIRASTVYEHRFYFNPKTLGLVGAFFENDVSGEPICDGNSYVVGEVPEQDCADAEPCNLCDAPQPWNELAVCETLDCETVRYNNRTLRHESLEDHCADNDCPRTIEEAESRQAVCTEESGTLMRRVGCGFQEVVADTFYGFTSLVFDDEGNLVGAANGLGPNVDRTEEVPVCEDFLFAAGNVPEDACDDLVSCAVCSGNPLIDLAFCD
jgi:hypothetical protein